MSAAVVLPVIDRLKGQVAALHSRVEDIADLSALIDSGQLPKQMPAAWVISLAEDAEPSTSMEITRQRVTERLGIVLVHRVAGDTTGAKAKAAIEAIADSVRDNLVGWAIGEAFDPLEYRRAVLLGIQKGCVFKQIDLVTRWHLRQAHTRGEP